MQELPSGEHFDLHQLLPTGMLKHLSSVDHLWPVHPWLVAAQQMNRVLCTCTLTKILLLSAECHVKECLQGKERKSETDSEMFSPCYLCLPEPLEKGSHRESLISRPWV